MHTANVVVQLVAAGKCFAAIFAIINECPIEMNVFNMLSQVVSLLSSLPTQCASVKFLTVLSSAMLNVPVQLLVFILPCKHQMSHQKRTLIRKIYLTICVTLCVCKADFLWKRSFRRICTGV